MQRLFTDWISPFLYFQFSSVTGLGLVTPGTIVNGNKGQKKPSFQIIEMSFNCLDNSKYQTKTVVNLTKNLPSQLPPQHISVLGTPNAPPNPIGQPPLTSPTQPPPQQQIFRTNLAMPPGTTNPVMIQGGSTSLGGLPPNTSQPGMTGTSENSTPVSSAMPPGSNTPNSQPPQLNVLGSDNRDA